MTLADLALPVSYEWGRAHALVFGGELASRLSQVQDEHGDPRHVPNAILLSDGRHMLPADILTECLPGGLVYSGFSHLDPARFGEIEVVPIGDITPFLPSESVA